MTEIATLRHYDGILYLPSEIFFQLYPLDDFYDSGTYGTIYKSGTKYVIKEFEKSFTHLDLSKELNFYSSINHPCIIKPLAWTVKNHKGYIIMKKGKDIKDAFNEKDINMEQIICDTLSAIGFLNSNGIAHCDIKPQNIIFHKGKAKLIDMGICKYAELNIDDEYYINDLAYTSNYKDPEYCETQYNNIKCEIYSLAATYWGIFENDEPKYGQVWDYKTEIPLFNLIIEQASQLIEDRQNIQDTLKSELITHKYVGTILYEGEYKNKCNQLLMREVIKRAYQYNMSARSLFLSLHLITRTYSSRVFPDKDTYITAILNICNNIFTISYVIESNFLENENSDDERDQETVDYQIKYEKTVIKILELTNGVIGTLTYWDYAKSVDDLIPLLNDYVYCRPISHSLSSGGGNKCIRVRDFMSSDFLPIISNSSEQFLHTIKPCELDTSANLEYLKSLLFYKDKWKNYTDEQFFPNILHNRDALKLLTVDDALDIFKFLLTFHLDKHNTSFVLDKICSFDWRKRYRFYIDNHLHPFI